MINPSGLINGEEVRKAIIGPQGNVVVSIPRITAIVPHAQSGVKAPTATLAQIETLGFRSKACLSFSESTYTFIIAAVRIAKLSGTQLCIRLPMTVIIIFVIISVNTINNWCMFFLLFFLSFLRNS